MDARHLASILHETKIDPAAASTRSAPVLMSDQAELFLA